MLVVQQIAVVIADLAVPAVQPQRLQTKPYEMVEVLLDDLPAVHPGMPEHGVVDRERRVVVDAEQRHFGAVVRPAEHAAVDDGGAVGRGEGSQGQEQEHDGSPEGASAAAGAALLRWTLWLAQVPCGPEDLGGSQRDEPRATERSDVRRSITLRLLIPVLLTSAALAAPLLDDTVLVPFEVPAVGSWDNVTSLARLSPEPAGQTGFVTIRESHFVDGAGRRLRFVGGALAFDANFPDHAAAEQLAARLQMVGINLVRLHHLDMGVAPRGIWSPEHPDRQHLDPRQLDRLDYLAAQLKAHGVYLNLNLHVSRTFGEADGFPEAAGLPTFDKGPTTTSRG